MSVVVLKPDHLGDFAVALPGLWEASRRFKNAGDLCVLASMANAEWGHILPWLPNVHGIYYPKYARPPGIDRRRLVGAFREAWKIGRAHRNFEWGIELTSWDAAPWGKLLLRATGAERLRGTAVRGQSWLMDETVNSRDARGHQSVRLAARFPVAWGISGTASPADFMPGDLRWKPSAAPRPIVVMPWAGEAFKEWPIEQWQALRKTDATPWRLLAPPERVAEAQAWRQIVNPAAGLIEIVPVASIRETLAALRDCSLAISVDTAAAHYAWLAGAPLVELFSAAADPEQWGSLAAGEIIAPERSVASQTLEAKRVAGGELMAHVTPERVAEAVRRVSNIGRSCSPSAMANQ